MHPRAMRSSAVRGSAKELLQRAYFHGALVFGRLLRASTYSSVHIVTRDGRGEVRKRRRFYAPLLVWLGDPLVRMLDTGVFVLAERAWVEREQHMYAEFHRQSVPVDSDGTLVLPVLPGATLAELLENSALDHDTRTTSIACAVVALAEFHRRGFTHGDAMAENVMVDVHTHRANWFDFETLHDARRPLAWRQADDLRALIATCLVRTPRASFAPTLNLILDTYRDDRMALPLVSMFSTTVQRPLPYHLGQAPLSYSAFQEIVRLLEERLRAEPAR